MSRPLLLAASGGLGREVAEAARAGTDWEPVGFVDDDPATWGTEVGGLPVLGGLASVTGHPTASVAVCAGSGAGRLRLARRLVELGVDDERLATVVHPRADVPASNLLGAGAVLLSGVVLTADVRVGRLVVCMPGVVLTHDDVLDEGATLCAGVVLGGSVRIGARAYLGMGAGVRENVTIGDGALVGMGSVVLQDVSDGQRVCGVPARPMASRGPTGVVAGAESKGE